MNLKRNNPKDVQKSTAFLEHIMRASSNEGDVVLDPFCGCGTTIAAAQNLGPEWIGTAFRRLARVIRIFF